MTFAGRRIDTRLALLAGAFLLSLGALLMPRIPVTHAVYSYLFVVDITRSMNVPDYQLGGQHVSRLEFVKGSLRRLLPQLPCGSRVGVGIFSERNTAILFMPVEVCGNFSAIDAGIAQIDWRMAWAADSNIAKGLYNTLQLMTTLANRPDPIGKTSLVFLTDGHEAPPINPRYSPDFSEIGRVNAAGEIIPGAVTLQRQSEAAAGAPARFDGQPGMVDGRIIGVGAYEMSPIPKFDEEGRRIGDYAEEDVPQATRFGEPTEEEKKAIVGYEARNAPWGKDAARGNEHLSQVREKYLQELAAKTGLGYHHLETVAGLRAALQTSDLAQPAPTLVHAGFVPASLALLLLIALYGIDLWRRRPARVETLGAVVGGEQPAVARLAA